MTNDNPTNGSADSPPQWSSLAFATSHDARPSDIDKDTCFLYRGSDNHLAGIADRGDEKSQSTRIQQEVRALAARWLRVENVSVLLGAGASYYLTEVLGRDIFDQVRSLLAGRHTGDVLDSILAEVDDVDQAKSNFESFLSQLSTLAYLGDPELGPITGIDPEPLVERSRAELQSLIIDIERAIAATFNTRLPPSLFSTSARVDDKVNISPHEALLLKLVARDAQAPRVSLFTTNYDTLLEQAMDRLGILYQDGFSGHTFRRFNPATYSLDYYYPGDVTQGRVQRYDKVLHLYKLHGSISWLRSSETHGGRFEVTLSNALLSDGDSSAIDLDRVLQGDRTLAILPTSTKYSETLAMPFAHLFRAFHQILSRPQNLLFIIGYSGWDHHINSLVIDALTNPSFAIVIVDPQPSAWARQLAQADAAGRVYLFGGPWGQMEFFAQNILPDLESLSAQIDVAHTIEKLRRDSQPDQSLTS